MDSTAILAIITQVLQVAALAVQAGKDAEPFAKILYDAFFGKAPQDVTQADLVALEAQLDALSAELQAPLPPE